MAVTDGGGKGERGIERGEERRREESVGVGLESVGDSCRGVAGSISVDRRHKLFQWTQSSGSISDSFLLLSPPLSLRLPFSRVPSSFFLAGQSVRFNRPEMFSGPAIFCSRGSLVLQPSLASILL